jgi:hypothetical protein
VLTQLEFPARYFDLVDQDPAVIAIVALRNGVLLALLAVTVATVAAPVRSTRPAVARSRSG